MFREGISGRGNSIYRDVKLHIWSENYKQYLMLQKRKKGNSKEMRLEEAGKECMGILCHALKLRLYLSFKGKPLQVLKRKALRMSFKKDHVSGSIETN